MNIIAILTLYKKPILFLASLLFITFLYFLSVHIYNRGYDSGIVYQQQQDKIATDKAKEKADSDRLALNSQLTEVGNRFEEYKTAAAERISVLETATSHYRTSNTNSSKQCLDEEWVDIYNKSLGD